MAVGYAFVCLISPYDVYYEVNTALYRLVLQIWPSALWTALLVARSWYSVEEYPDNSAAQSAAALDFTAGKRGGLPRTRR